MYGFIDLLEFAESLAGLRELQEEIRSVGDAKFRRSHKLRARLLIKVADSAPVNPWAICHQDEVFLVADGDMVSHARYAKAWLKQVFPLATWFRICVEDLPDGEDILTEHGRKAAMETAKLLRRIQDECRGKFSALRPPSGYYPAHDAAVWLRWFFGVIDHNVSQDPMERFRKLWHAQQAERNAFNCWADEKQSDYRRAEAWRICQKAREELPALEEACKLSELEIIAARYAASYWKAKAS